MLNTFRKSIIKNVIEIIKPKKKESEIRTVDFSKNIERNSKSFIKKFFNANPKSKSKNKDKDLTYKMKNINHSKEKNEKKSLYNSKKNINLNIDSIQKKNLTLINNNTQIFHTQSVQAPAKERNKNKLLKRVGVKDKIKKKNLVNNLTVQQNYDNLNKNQNSNSSFNSNSLFNQNMFQPQANNNKKIKDDSPDKSCNDRHNKEKKVP